MPPKMTRSNAVFYNFLAGRFPLFASSSAAHDALDWPSGTSIILVHHHLGVLKLQKGDEAGINI